MAAADDDDDDDDGCHMKKNMMNVATRESWKVDSCPPQTRRSPLLQRLT